MEEENGPQTVEDTCDWCRCG